MNIISILKKNCKKLLFTYWNTEGSWYPPNGY